MTNRNHPIDADHFASDVRAAESQVKRIDTSIASDRNKLDSVAKEIAQADALTKRLARRGSSDAAAAAEKTRLQKRHATIARRLKVKARRLSVAKAHLRHVRRLASGWRQACERLGREWQRSVTKLAEPRLGDRASRVITGEQLRATRTLLRTTRRDLAGQLGISERQLVRFENTRGPIEAPKALSSSIRRALRKAGVELIGPGVYVGTGGFGVRLRDVASATENVVRLPSPKPRARRGRTTATS